MLSVDFCPVDLGDVAEVRDARPVVSHDLAWCGVELGVRDEARAEVFFHRESESAVSGEQAECFHATLPVCSAYSMS